MVTTERKSVIDEQTIKKRRKAFPCGRSPFTEEHSQRGGGERGPQESQQKVNKMAASKLALLTKSYLKYKQTKFSN